MNLRLLGNRRMILVIKLTIIFSFFILGAYATTDIIRLTSKSDLPINAGECYCPVCQNKIRLRDQIPTVSYLINKGKCHFCQSPLPKDYFYFEIIIYLGCSIITLITNFSLLSFLLVVVYYELIKIIILIKNGIKEKNFKRSLIFSIFMNCINFGLIYALFFMNWTAEKYL